MTPETAQILNLVSGRKMIAVIGSRGYDDYQHFSAWVHYYTQNILNACFVSGGCPSGADKLIEDYASDNYLPAVIFYPQYFEYGKRAPLERNKQIVEASNMLIAFWDGKSTGTAHTIGLAREKNIPIRIINI